MKALRKSWLVLLTLAVTALVVLAGAKLRMGELHIGYGGGQRVAALVRSPALARAARALNLLLVRDELWPERPARRVRPVPAWSDGWQRARPDPEYQYSLSDERRGGRSPCSSLPVDTSRFTPWEKLPSTGSFSVPVAPRLGSAERFDLIVHFHGHDAARRQLIAADLPIVLVGMSLEPGDSFTRAFSSQDRFERLLGEIEAEMSRRAGRPQQVGRLALTAWSAGYGAIHALLFQPVMQRVDAVVLIDGLHAPRERERYQLELEPFVGAARRAAERRLWMVVTHSSIDPPTFASTTETAHHLIHALGGVPVRVARRDPLGLELVELYSQGDFHVRGYAGNDKADHCAQFAAYGMTLRALGRRWAEPSSASASTTSGLK